MIRAAITLLTMYQLDQTIFDGLTLPSRPFTDRGYQDLFLTGWDMDKTVFINNLLMETAELNVLYTNPQFFKFAVTQWALKEKPVWQSLYETIFFKYNPIWNKDGTYKHNALETRNLANGLTRTNSDSGTVTETRDLENGLTVNGTNSGTMSETSGNTRSTDAEENTQREETSKRVTSESMEGDVVETEIPRVEDTTTVTYNTNENKDYLTTNGGTLTTAGTKSGTENVDTVDSGTDTTENKVSAFDISTYQNRERSDTTKGTREDRDTTNSETSSETVTDARTVTDRGDLAKTGTEETVVEHTGNNEKQTNYDTVKTIDDELKAHGDDTTRTLDETVTDSGTRSQQTSGTESRTDAGTETGTIETEHSNSGTQTQTGTDTGTISNAYTDEECGNIGVTMTQQMIEAERNLVKFNIYDVIIESFKQRFCLLIY